MTWIIAHRGASQDAPENTLAAFREAWVQLADGIEGDFRYTSDQQVVCIHDNDLKRTGRSSNFTSTTNADASRQGFPFICEIPWQELSQVDVGSWKADKFHQERIPLLRDVLLSAPQGKWCVLELKTGPEIVPWVKQVIDLARFPSDRLLIIAFDSTTIARSKQLMPDVRAHWLVDYHESQPTIWHPTVDQIAETVHQCQADGVGSQALRSVVNESFVADLRRSGVKEFHLWTVDDPEDAKYYCQLGAWGITTNRPGWMPKAFQKS